MKFLLDANIPRSAGGVLKGLGHEAVDVRDALPPGADDATVATLARAHHLVLVTRDFDFADIRNYPPEAYAGIVVLELPEDAIAERVNEVLKSFVSNEALIGRLKGRLAIVESWRVRFRPAETSE
jgi:predicted nuclease of predicted toxin-antitoxin system